MKRVYPLLFILIILILSSCSTARQMGSHLSAAQPAPASTPTTTLATTDNEVPNPGAPDIADYAIAVRLDPAEHRLTGRETITYHNATQKPIPDLVFHLYLNAFKSTGTVFMKESGGQLRGDLFNPQNNGWTEVDSIRFKGGPALKLDLLEDGTLARAALPEPVGPGGKVEVEVAFRAQLPQVFARTGWALDAHGAPFFLVGQWFPKLGVWTADGWNAQVFHGNAEFFADFGSYNVAITLPQDYVTGATGLPDGVVKNSDGTQTVSYHASGVIDFAWVASPDLRTATRKVGGLEIVYLYLPEHEWSKTRELDDTEKSVTQYGDWFGAYPYARLTVVDVPDKGRGAGGMEYPTFVTVGANEEGSSSRPTNGWADGLLITTAHEVAHQWWQSMVATNEAEEPWLDEGFADTSTMLLLIKDYGLDSRLLDQSGSPYVYLLSRRRSFLRDPGVPMDRKSWEFSWPDYVIASYAKPDMALLTLGREVGDQQLFAILRAYFQRYRFAHPTTADFQQVAEQVSGQSLDWFFNGLVYKSETINYVAKSISGDQITVERQGALDIPVDIQVTFEDSSQVTVPWDGKDAQHTLTFDKPVKSFDIDPGHKLLIEVNWQDNQISSSTP